MGAPIDRVAVLGMAADSHYDRLTVILDAALDLVQEQPGAEEAAAIVLLVKSNQQLSGFLAWLQETNPKLRDRLEQFPNPRVCILPGVLDLGLPAGV